MSGSDPNDISTFLKIANVLEEIIFDRKSKKKHKLLAIELHLKFMDAARSELDKRKKA
jgi:hypothetical protein